MRGHWDIENRLHWVLDMTFDDDQYRLRKGFGAKNMAVVRYFVLDLYEPPTTLNQPSFAAKWPAGPRLTSTASLTSGSIELGS